MTASVHEALRAKDLLPGTHLVDAGYVDADLLIDAQAAHGIELVGPVRPDTSWQAQAGQGYAISAFAVDWEAKTVTCPQGHKSVDWVVNRDPWGTGTVHVGFAKATCRACPSRPLCTRAKAAPRALTLRREGRHEAIQAMRKRQDAPEWRALYGARAGIEGCLSQGIRLCGLRRSRYVGLANPSYG
jgi:transposase